MRRTIATFALLLATALACAQAGRWNHLLLDARMASGFSRAHPLENTPPLVAFTTVALGGFCGLLVDLLWLRASQLQEEGRYFELVQLATWITELEPRIAAVWVFHAWNLAYNVSVLFEDPADRWRWVQHGIRLLRDRGLHYNPGDPELYHQLGWLFQHKIGDVLDQAHLYYKRALASQMTDALGGPAPDYAALRADPQSPRARRLREELRMDPQRMEEVDARFGPLDWRLPEAHAIYWAYCGRPYAQGFDALQLDRMLFQSLVTSFRRGRLVTSPEDENVFVMAPNLDLLPRVRAMYEEALARYPDEETVRASHRNFLEEAAVLLYVHRRLAEARDVYAELRRRYPAEDFPEDVTAMARRWASERLTEWAPRQAAALIHGALVQSGFWRVLGDEERAQGYEELARTAWESCMARLADSRVREREGLPPWRDLQRAAFEELQRTLTNRAWQARLERLLSAPPQTAGAGLP